MKKLFIAIVLFITLISNSNNRVNFSLLDYFNGEYTSYTENKVDQESVNLGFCYMQNKTVTNENIIGESLKINNFEVAHAIKQLNAEVIKTESLDNDTIVIYAYSKLIDEKVKVDNKNVNIQIAHNDEYSVIGWPLILGGF